MIDFYKVSKEAVHGATAVSKRAAVEGFKPFNDDWVGFSMDLEATSLVVRYRLGRSLNRQARRFYA